MDLELKQGETVRSGVLGRRQLPFMKLPERTPSFSSSSLFQFHPSLFHLQPSLTLPSSLWRRSQVKDEGCPVSCPSPWCFRTFPSIHPSLPEASSSGHPVWSSSQTGLVPGTTVTWPELQNQFWGFVADYGIIHNFDFFVAAQGQLKDIYCLSSVLEGNCSYSALQHLFIFLIIKYMKPWEQLNLWPVEILVWILMSITMTTAASWWGQSPGKNRLIDAADKTNIPVLVANFRDKMSALAPGPAQVDATAEGAASLRSHLDAVAPGKKKRGTEEVWSCYNSH